MVKIDSEKCLGCGTCVAVCPEGFELKEGKSTIKNPKAKCIAKAISACPVGAITKWAELVIPGHIGVTKEFKYNLQID